MGEYGEKKEEREGKKEKENLKIHILNIMSLVKMYEIQFKLIFFTFFLTIHWVEGRENNNNPIVMLISSIYTDIFKNYFSVNLLRLNQK